MRSHSIHLPYTSPYDWAAALRFFAARAVDGVEQVEGDVYRRTVRIGDATGVLEVRNTSAQRALAATLRIDGSIEETEVTARLRNMLDLDADLPLINAHLSRDPLMSPLVAACPALRVFGGWDRFEVAMRTVNGQQVSVERARRLNGVLVVRCGADLRRMGMPGARVATLWAVAEAAMVDPGLFNAGSSLDATIARLRAIKGIGEWTAHYIAMRACRQPDAFPASDVGLLRGAADRDGSRPTAAALLARAEAWRPWRAYAAHHLWNLDSAASRGVRAVVSDATVEA